MQWPKLETYYKDYQRNTGRIKSINGQELVASFNAGRNGPVLTLPLTACHGFVPQLDDRVLLCVDEAGELALEKLSKWRQDNPPIRKPICHLKN